jgi:hypothetical protein
MDACFSAAAQSNLTVSRPRGTPRTKQPRAVLNVGDAILRVVIAVELEEAQSLKDGSKGTSDSTMARRSTNDQLLSCQAIDSTEGTTNVEVARAMSPSSSSTDACTCGERSLEVARAY